MAQTNEEAGRQGDAQTQINAAKQAADLVNARMALAKAQADLQRMTAAAAQRQAEADQAKALAAAQSQAAEAKYIGDVKAGPYSGGVTAKENAGAEEAKLLAAKAVREAAARVAGEVRGLKPVIYVFAAGEFPRFQRLTAYRFRVETLRQAFAAVGVTAPEKGQGVAGAHIVFTPEIASAGLDAFAKLLGFFKTDYEVGGQEVKLDESLLVNAVAGQLARGEGGAAGQGAGGREVHVPTVYSPATETAGTSGVMKDLMELFALRRAAETQRAALQKNEGEGAETDAAGKEKLDQLAAVVALFDQFVASLSAADGGGATPVVALAQEVAIDAALRAGAGVLLLRLDSSGGGYLIKKNLWTGLGRMPMYSMGGATVTYLLLDGPEGRVLAGDTVPVYGGFERTDGLRDVLGR